MIWLAEELTSVASVNSVKSDHKRIPHTIMNTIPIVVSHQSGLFSLRISLIVADCIVTFASSFINNLLCNRNSRINAAKVN